MRFFHLGGRTWRRDNANANDMAKAKLLGKQIQAPALQRHDGGRILQRQLVWRTIGVAVVSRRLSLSQPEDVSETKGQRRERIIGGAIIAAAPAVVFAFYKIFGLAAAFSAESCAHNYQQRLPRRCSTYTKCA